MGAPYSNLRSKLNRAICAYLIEQACGTVDDTLVANSRGDQPNLRTIIHATIARPDPPLTGNYRIPVHISIQGQAAKDAAEPDVELARKQFDERCAKVYDALMQSDDDETLRATATAVTAAGRAMAVAVDDSEDAAKFAADNADMVDFTVIGWFDGGFGDGTPEDHNCTWEEIMIFDVLCCSSNVD